MASAKPRSENHVVAVNMAADSCATRFAYFVASKRFCLVWNGFVLIAFFLVVVWQRWTSLPGTWIWWDRLWGLVLQVVPNPRPSSEKGFNFSPVFMILWTKNQLVLFFRHDFVEVKNPFSREWPVVLQLLDRHLQVRGVLKSYMSFLFLGCFCRVFSVFAHGKEWMS